MKEERTRAQQIAVLLLLCVFAPVTWSSPEFAAAQRIRNQDAAFSLLIEAFRQIQGALVQSDYESRLRAVAVTHNYRLRETVTVLADIERHLRMQKLSNQVARLLTTYEYARRYDEREAGVLVPGGVDLKQAAVQLVEFVPIRIESDDAPVFVANSVEETPAGLRHCQAGLDLLRQHFPAQTAALDETERLLRRHAAALPSSAPALILISYRLNAAEAVDVVVQVFPTLKASASQRADFFAPLDNWVKLVSENEALWFGPEDAVRQRKRAFTQLLNADTSLLAQQLVEPMLALAIVPAPAPLLPASLRDRVRAVMLGAELSAQDWRGTVELETADARDAAYVSELLGLWREMLLPLARNRAAGEASIQLGDALRRSGFEARGNGVQARAALAHQLALRGLSKAARWATEAEPWDAQPAVVASTPAR